MEYEKIEKLIEDMGKSKLTELEIEFPEGLKISMKKENGKVDEKEHSKKNRHGMLFFLHLDVSYRCEL